MLAKHRGNCKVKPLFLFLNRSTAVFHNYLFTLLPILNLHGTGFSLDSENSMNKILKKNEGKCKTFT